MKILGRKGKVNENTATRKSVLFKSERKLKDNGKESSGERAHIITKHSLREKEKKQSRAKLSRAIQTAKTVRLVVLAD